MKTCCDCLGTGRLDGAECERCEGAGSYVLCALCEEQPADSRGSYCSACEAYLEEESRLAHETAHGVGR